MRKGAFGRFFYGVFREAPAKAQRHKGINMFLANSAPWRECVSFPWIAAAGEVAVHVVLGLQVGT